MRCHSFPMISTLRVGGARSSGAKAMAKERLPGALGLALRRQGLSNTAVQLRRPLAPTPGFRLVRQRFCGDSSGSKPPPKGFEHFYRKPGQSAKAAEGAEGAEAEGSKGKAPAEGPVEAKEPNAKETKAEAKDEAGPKETPKESKETGKEGKETKDSKDSKGKKDSNTVLEKGGAPQNIGLMVGIAAVALYYMSGSRQAPQDEVTIQEMMRDYLMKGYVDKIQIVNKSWGRIHLRQDAPGDKAGKPLVIQLGTPEAFEGKIEQLQNELGISPLDHVPIQYVTETDYLQEFLPHLPSLLIMIPLLIAASSMAGGMGGMGGGGGPGGAGRNVFNFGKAFNAKKKELSNVKFEDVAGLHQAKKEVVEFVDFLRDPKKYEKLGARVPKGGLLVGPPGTGKTLLAKAVAGEAGVPFYTMSGSDFVEMFVGVGPSRVRDLFAQARATAPSIIFIDEIDAVGRKRGKSGFSGSNDERENTLNAMLVEMDGFTSSTGLVVLAGTNRADVLDPALLRPGRFDRQIAIDKPDLAEREDIFMVHLKKVTIDKSLEVKHVAQRMAALTPGFAGADIANICNEAAIFAARRSGDAVIMKDFELATERVIGGLPKTNSLMSKEDRRKVALHECGHAIVGWYMQYADPLLKVSIIPRSNGALGFAQYLPEEMSLYSKEAILDKIAVALGGRAAEELYVGAISTGASDDLDKVTKMAYAMVSVYGMNPELGLVSFQQNNSSEQFYKPYSEETGRVIDREARIIVDEQYARVKALLLEKKETMVSLADLLCEKETLVYNDLRGVLGERPFGVKAQYQKFVTAGSLYGEDDVPKDASAEPPKEGAGEAGGDGPKSVPLAA